MRIHIYSQNPDVSAWTLLKWLICGKMKDLGLWGILGSQQKVMGWLILLDKWQMDTIEGYQVKPEFIPMLRKILSKHGDVMEMFLRIPWYSQRYSGQYSQRWYEMFLRTLCGIILELQDKGLDKITEDELRNMFGVANEIKNMKVNTEWLFLRLEEILEARQILGQSGILKEEKDNNRKVIETAKRK